MDYKNTLNMPKSGFPMRKFVKNADWSFSPAR